MQSTTVTDWLTKARRLGVLTDGSLPLDDGSVLAQAAANDCLEAYDALAIRDLMEAAGNFDEDLALLLAAAFFELNKGSVCLVANADALSPLTCRICGGRKDDLVGRIVDELKLLRMGKGRWRDLIGLEPEAFKPLILVESGGREHLYFQRNLVNSLTLEARMESLCHSPLSPLADAAKLAKVLSEVLSLQPHALNDRQRIAVGTAALQRFSIVSGGPGTGKTSIVVALLQCMLRCGVAPENIRAVAPTGRAAQRMSESIRSLLPENADEVDAPLHGLNCQTLHSLLGYSPARQGFLHDEEFPLKVDAVIVDEVSMVDVEMMSALLRALPDHARVVFLGDKDQLPSVEAGAILADLIPADASLSATPGFRDELRQLVADSADTISVLEGDDPMMNRITVLDVSYRSERSILDLAARINCGDPDATAVMEKLSLQKRGLPFGDIGHGAFHCDVSTASRDRLRAILDSWAVAHYLQSTEIGWSTLIQELAQADLSDLSAPDDILTARLDDLFIHLHSAQILTLTRYGDHGVAGMNAYLESRLRPVCDPDGRGRYFHGQPILVLRNDRTWGLFNGDVGIVLRGADNHYRAVFRRMNAYVSLGLEALPATEPAFAITVHKSQGSEYDRVVFIMPPKEDSPLLCREILYTGITRAKNAVIMIGGASVIAAAASRKNHRQGGVGFWADPAMATLEAEVNYDDLPLFQ